MFSKKQKKSKEELAAEREERVQATQKNLKIQISAMEKKRELLLSKVLEARQKGLPNQESQARGLLRQCLASQKQANAMLMTLELAIQSRDLANLNQQFVECIGALSDDIVFASKKTNTKKAEKKYLHSVYAFQQQTEKINGMLEMGDYAAAASVGGDRFTEFDEEIDGMIESAELGVVELQTPISKNKF